MAIPNGLAKIVISGNLSTGEIWNTGFWVDGYTEADFEADVNLDNFGSSPPWAAFLEVVRAMLSTGDGTRAVDAYFYQGGAAVQHSHGSIAAAGTGARSHPKQIAAVMTLRTGLATRSGRGRMYLPATGVDVATSGLFTGGLIEEAVEALANLLTLYSGGSLTPVVVSQTNSSFRTITSVDADLVPDTQRRRRNGLTSSRHSAAV